MPGKGGPSPTGSMYTGNGLLDEEAYNRARQQQSQMGLWAGLLAGSGPSLSPRGFGSSFGQGLLGMQAAGEKFDDSQLAQAKVALARAGIPKTEAEIRKLDREGKLFDVFAQAASQYMQGGGVGGAPAYSPMGGAALPSSGGAANIEPGSDSDPRGVSPLIRAKAAENGIDPDVALRVARSEGLGQFYGDGGKSGTAFQLYTGGGWGNDFQRETGLNPLDPKNEPAAIDYTMKRVAREGWGAFNGAKKIGIRGFDGIGQARAPEQMASAAIPEFAGGRAAQLGGGVGILPLSNEAAPVPPITQATPSGRTPPITQVVPPGQAVPSGRYTEDNFPYPVPTPAPAAQAPTTGLMPGGAMQQPPPVPPIAQPPQMAAPPVAPPIAMPQAPRPPQMPPQQAPRMGMPGNIDPQQIRAAQAMSIAASGLGRTVPEFIGQTAGLPIAGMKAGAEAAARQPYELQRMQEQQRLDIGKAGPVASAEDSARRTPDQKEYASYVAQELAAGRPPLSQFDYTKAVKQAGATNLTQRIEGQGQVKMIEAGIEQMKGAFQAEAAAQKRTQVFGQMAEAMRGVSPGATADLKRRAGAIWKDLVGVDLTGVPSAEMLQQATRKLQITAAPQGQGAVSNYERELFAQASPQLINTPEALAQMIQIGQRLDNYDRQVAQIHRDVARESGGLPNFIEAQQRIAALGPPLSPEETAALQSIQKPAEGGAGAPAQSGVMQTPYGTIRQK